MHTRLYTHTTQSGMINYAHAVMIKLISMGYIILYSKFSG